MECIFAHRKKYSSFDTRDWLILVFAVKEEELIFSIYVFLFT